jgi:plastocyanin
VGVNAEGRRMTTRIATTALAATALGLALVPAATPASATKVNGTVGPGFTIGLTKAGKKVTTLKAGRVTFVVNDKGSIHNFALDGPNGFEKKLTDVSFTGTKTVTLTLKKGTYKFYCEPHESSMFGNFKVS